MIGVVIATYGDRDLWSPYVQRAAESVDRQTVPPVGRVWVHHDTLAAARNEGAVKLGSERPVGQDRADQLIFLDADDELDERYIEKMTDAHDAATFSSRSNAAHFVFRPNTIGVHEDGHTDPEPCMIPRTDMRRTNCCVIGSMASAELFSEVGGFAGYDALEDFALFRAMLARGAELVDVPDAVYRVHVRAGSRNAPEGAHHAAYRQILHDIPL